MCVDGLQRVSADDSVFFFFEQKTAYVVSACLVGSEMYIRDSYAVACLVCHVQSVRGVCRYI